MLKNQRILSPGKTDLAMIAVTVFWGLGTVVMKNVIGDTPGRLNIFIFNGLRLPVGALLLFLTAIIQGKNIFIQRRHIPYFLLSTLAGAANSLAFLFGLQLTSSSNAGIILGTVPLFILLFAFLIGSEQPTKRMLLGIAVGFGGSFVLSFRGGSFVFSPGDMLVMAGCSLLGLFTVLTRKMLDHYSTAVASGWYFILITVYQLPFFIYYLPGQGFREIASVTWLYFAITVIGPMFLASILYYYAIREIGPSRVGSYTFLTPVFTLFFAALIRHEQIYLQHIAGLVVIIAGVSIVRSEKRHQAEEQTAA